MAERSRFRRQVKVGRGKSTGVDAYDKLHKYVASKNQLDRHGFPRPSGVVAFADFRTSALERTPDSESKECTRCGQQFVLRKCGEVLGGSCTYHCGRCFDDIWKCCGAKRGTIGCMKAETHVHSDNAFDKSGYVQTSKKRGTNPGIFAIDCEMSYTIAGLELTRVSAVDQNCEVVLDTYVKPFGRVLSYNTEHSGVTEQDLVGVDTTLKDVQKFLTEKFSADTILIGHSLESDFRALRLIHETVVDTALVFTHPMGYPYKFKLRTLAKKHLGKTVQEGLHDSVEDASTCMQIMMKRISPQG